MIKNFRKILFLFIVIFISLNIYTNAIDLPVNCVGIPGCKGEDPALPTNGNTHEILVFGLFGKVISEGVKYVAVIAVVALMLAGLNLVVGGGLSGEEEKVSKAKKWVLWALVGVVLSVSAWWIINILNNLEIK